MQPTHRSVLPGLVVLAALLGLAACAGTVSSAPTDSRGSTRPPRSVPSGPSPAGLSASLVQYRRDQPRRFVEVKLVNDSETARDVTLLGVALPGFRPPPDVVRTTHLEPDRRVDLPVALADVICDRPPEGTANATVEVVTDGRAVRTTLPVEDDGLLDRLRAFECAVQRADKAVAIELSPTWRRQGNGPELTVQGTATITAQSSDLSAEVVDIDGGLLFVIKPQAVAPRPPIDVDARRPQATVTFEMIPARCDGHAIAEAKRLTTVTFLVAVDGAEPVPLRRAPAEAGYQTLVSALRERCATG